MCVYIWWERQFWRVNDIYLMVHEQESPQDGAIQLLVTCNWAWLLRLYTSGSSSVLSPQDFGVNLEVGSGLGRDDKFIIHGWWKATSEGAWLLLRRMQACGLRGHGDAKRFFSSYRFWYIIDQSAMAFLWSAPLWVNTDTRWQHVPRYYWLCLATLWTATTTR